MSDKQLEVSLDRQIQEGCTSNKMRYPKTVAVCCHAIDEMHVYANASICRQRPYEHTARTIGGGACDDV